MARRRKYDIFAIWLGSLIFIFLLGITLTFSFAAPSGPPPAGVGAISADANGNVRVSGLCIGSDCRGAWPTASVTPETNAKAAASGTASVAVSCGTLGKKAVGGGCSTANANCKLTGSYFSAVNQWTCTWDKDSGKSGSCATPSPGTAYIICI